MIWCIAAATAHVRLVLWTIHNLIVLVRGLDLELGLDLLDPVVDEHRLGHVLQVMVMVVAVDDGPGYGHWVRLAGPIAATNCNHGCFG